MTASASPVGILRVSLATCLLSCLSGCGLGLVENQSGGGDNLPTQAAGPYGKLEVDSDTVASEPFVVSVRRTNVRDPAPLWRADGGFRLWFGYEDDPNVDLSEIWYAELSTLQDLPEVAPTPALTADATWEEDRVGAPSILELEDGRLVMFYQGGQTQRSIGRADSSDGGQTWTKHPENPVLEGWYAPSVIENPADGGGSWTLYGNRGGMPGIFRADSPDGDNWTPTGEAVIMPRVGTPEAYDRHSVSDPFVVVREISAGEYQYGMFFNAADSGDAEASISVGWAGSFDGFEWQRFDNPDGPVLAPEGPSEHGPAVLVAPAQGIMFYNELNQGVQAIAVAVHP